MTRVCIYMQEIMLTGPQWAGQTDLHGDIPPAVRDGENQKTDHPHTQFDVILSFRSISKVAVKFQCCIKHKRLFTDGFVLTAC